MEEQTRLFDVCIVCALYEEAAAVIDEFSRRCHTKFIKAYHGLDHYEYQYTTIQNRNKEPLSVLVTWLPEMGPSVMAQEIKSLVQQFHPRFMTMTGICAGDKRKVQLGDLIIASAAYHYEEGKITSEAQGYQPATRTFGPADQVLQYTQGFIGWEKPVIQMKEQFLQHRLQTFELPKRIVAPMASGIAVRADDPFLWLQQQYHRHTVGLDMETASFYSALRSFTHALVVKGVCDYADLTKNDTYHDYAARASAVYVLRFIQEYVTQETMPRPQSENHNATSHNPLQKHFALSDKKMEQWVDFRKETPDPLARLIWGIQGVEPGRPFLVPPKPTNVRVTYQPSLGGNKGTIIFVLNETEHTLEYLRRDNITHQIFSLRRKQQELVRLVVPFATLKPLEKQVKFQIDGVDCLFTFKMSAITSIMSIKLEIGGKEVFRV